MWVRTGPISLLNADVKILARVLAKRMEDSVPGVVTEDQTGFVKGRQLASNIRRLLNVVMSPSGAQVPEVWTV